MVIDTWIRSVFDSLYDGILIIDRDETVKYVNASYTRITGVRYEDIVERKLREVRHGARLPNVLQSRKPIIGALREENGVDYVVNMSPILSKGEVVGAISIASSIDDALDLSQTLNRYQSKIAKLEGRMKAIQKARYTIDDMVAQDPRSKEVRKLLLRIAKKDTTILLSGESGTGKEMAAQAIHNASGRADGPFIAVNCASFGVNLLESELFGYEEGSFTGAKKDGKLGLFEAADGGTIFLDEIAEIGAEVQAKLLRTLQEKTVRRIGGIREIPVDVRVIAATNKDLETMVSSGSFREDLFYRLSVFPVVLPPLRDRRADIIPLVESFLVQHKNDLKSDIGVSDDAKKMLIAYRWPGNIRELRNTIEFAVNMMENDTITSRNLPVRIQASVDSDAKSERLSDMVRKFEKEEIAKLLNLHGHTLEGKKKVAEILGISLASLYSKIK
ncbi:MAG: sigma 54-interacting transcriptional regulator [Youngiibacter sp.]|nr:sigma 54-interacting transcriptional regulator [Youngiibacter sp.]